ncbi:unnamed protein product [Gadus morhua 'NCC']
MRQEKTFYFIGSVETMRTQEEERQVVWVPGSNVHENYCAGGSRGLAGPPGTSWGSEVDLTEASQPLELNQPDAIEASLLVGPDEAVPMVAGGVHTSSLNPAVSVDLHKACKRAAARLNIEWPEPPLENATSL